MRLLGRPVIQSEHLNPVGDLSDVLLADLSQYVLFLRKDVTVETSNAVHWMTDEVDFRAILRADGMGLWATAGKRPGDSSASEGWLVRLGAR
jgi:HK97 family phage major capsid protein